MKKSEKLKKLKKLIIKLRLEGKIDDAKNLQDYYDMVSQKNEKPTVIKVTINGKEIFKKTAKETFVITLKEIGVANLLKLETPILLRGTKKEYDEIGNNYFARTNTSSEAKKKTLIRISEDLGINLKVELIDKKTLRPQ